MSSTSTSAEVFANTAVTDFADWAQVVSEQAINTGADETDFSWTLWSALNN